MPLFVEITEVGDVGNAGNVQTEDLLVDAGSMTLTGSNQKVTLAIFTPLTTYPRKLWASILAEENCYVKIGPAGSVDVTTTTIPRRAMAAGERRYLPISPGQAIAAITR